MRTRSGLFNNESREDVEVHSAPLGAAKKGHLEITRGISNLYLRGDPTAHYLFQGQFAGLIPHVWARNELLTIHYPISVTEWFQNIFLGNKQIAEITLNTFIPWQIDIRGGAAHLNADMRALQLSSLLITGGVAETSLLLPCPSGTVKIHIGSGVSNLRIFHPAGVSTRLKVGGGANGLTFDNKNYGSIADKNSFETTGYEDQTNRYDISVHGGVSNLVIRGQA